LTKIIARRPLKAEHITRVVAQVCNSTFSVADAGGLKVCFSKVSENLFPKQNTN
jgi:hypothetical protein